MMLSWSIFSIILISLWKVWVSKLELAFDIILTAYSALEMLSTHSLTTAVRPDPSSMSSCIEYLLSNLYRTCLSFAADLIAFVCDSLNARICAFRSSKSSWPFGPFRFSSFALSSVNSMALETIFGTDFLPDTLIRGFLSPLLPSLSTAFSSSGASLTSGEDQLVGRFWARGCWDVVASASSGREGFVGVFTALRTRWSSLSSSMASFF
mmetsp:Transcript_29183/g.40592  ORF Transcript_29183/g.40592 Transcript_29183/m.40592 type:complete len:209 (-) Transcript_29183:605-1231(-)